LEILSIQNKYSRTNIAINMETTHNNIPLRVVSYPPSEEKNPKYKLVIHENPNYSREVLDKYIYMLAKCVDSHMDINNFFNENGLGFVWGELILGAIFIYSTGEIVSYGDTKISKGFIKYGNKKCSVQDIPGVNFSVPTSNHENLFFLVSPDLRKIKDILWYLLIGVSTYYALTELIKIIF